MQRLVRLDPPLLCLATRFGNTPQEIWRTRSASHDCEGGAIALRYLWKQQSQRKANVMKESLGPDDEPEKETPTDAEAYEPSLRGARAEDEDDFDSG